MPRARYHRPQTAGPARRTANPDRTDAMPIPLTCACGRSLRIRDALAGRKVKCPGCGRALAVPAPAAEEGPLEVLPAAPPPQAVTNVPPRPRQEEPLDVVPADAPADERAGGYAIQTGPPPAEPRPRRRKRRRVPRGEEEEARHERPAPERASSLKRGGSATPTPASSAACS